MKEIDLYKPIHKYFRNLGFKVNAEVSNFDVVLFKDEIFSIVEIKLKFNLILLRQAINAQKIADFVYVAIPIPNKKDKNFNTNIHIAKSLGIGIITVGKTASVILEPSKSPFKKNYNKIKKVKNEVENRKVEINLGGSTRKKINTVYREKNIQIACHLEGREAQKPKDLVKEGCSPDAQKILYNNFFGYFTKLERGKYALSKAGYEMLLGEEFKEVYIFFKKNLKKD